MILLILLVATWDMVFKPDYPGSLESALARALGDPALRIAYWLPSSQRYVDANGRPVDEPTPEPSRAVTTLVQDERQGLHGW